MNNQKHLHYYILLALLLFICNNIGISQTAVCKGEITVSTNPWACSYTLLPSDINNGSTDYDVLTINKTNLTDLGPHLVTLTASKNSGQSSTCTCTVNLADKSAPIAVGKESITVALNDQNSFTLLPSMLDNGSYDHCSAVSFSVKPSIIDCNSPNPLQATLTVTDTEGNYNQVITWVNIIQNKQRVKAIVCKGDITFGVPSKDVFEITADSLLEGGPYACPSFYDVTLKYNNISLPEPKVGPADVGKTFDYKVTDPETLNFCTGRITIIALDCSNALNVCDTKNRCTPAGDCNSGHTLTDDIEWPCDITLINAPAALISNPEPHLIADHLKVPIDSIKPVFFNGLTNNNKCIQIGENIKIDDFENRARIIYTYINWQEDNFIPISYTQWINFSTSESFCIACDTRPWNTLSGDCNSGHTINDAVEWPADITVDFIEVSPYDLSINESIHPNDVSPTLNTLCENTWVKTYTDIISETGPSIYSVERNWVITNTESNQNYSYIQTITINAPIDNNRHICFSTVHDASIRDVVIDENIVSGDEGCSTITYHGSVHQIKPYKEDTDFQNGLDVEDVIILKEFLFGLDSINDMQKSAADLNADNEVNNNDVNILTDLMTNKTFGSPHYDSPWKFLNANDFYYKNTLNDATNIASPFERYHFKGMKIGDLNDSYNRDEIINKITAISLDDQVLTQGETYSVKTFNVGDLRIKGMQMAIAKNDAFEIISVLGSFFNVDLVDKGDYYLIVGIAEDPYLKSDGLALENQTSMLKIIIRAKQNVVLHDVFKLYDTGNKIVQGINRELSSIQFNYNGSIPTSVLDFYEDQITVFPNPTTGMISIMSSKETINSVKIMSFDGKVMYSSSDLASNTIDISHLSNGFYTLDLTLSNGMHMIKKVIKM
jgi:hypothetical protein